MKEKLKSLLLLFLIFLSIIQSIFIWRGNAGFTITGAAGLFNNSALNNSGYNSRYNNNNSWYNNSIFSNGYGKDSNSSGNNSIGANDIAIEYIKPSSLVISNGNRANWVFYPSEKRFGTYWQLLRVNLKNVLQDSKPRIYPVDLWDTLLENRVYIFKYDYILPSSLSVMLVNTTADFENENFDENTIPDIYRILVYPMEESIYINTGKKLLRYPLPEGNINQFSTDIDQLISELEDSEDRTYNLAVALNLGNEGPISIDPDVICVLEGYNKKNFKYQSYNTLSCRIPDIMDLENGDTLKMDSLAQVLLGWQKDSFLFTYDNKGVFTMKTFNKNYTIYNNGLFEYNYHPSNEKIKSVGLITSFEKAVSFADGIKNSLLPGAEIRLISINKGKEKIKETEKNTEAKDSSKGRVTSDSKADFIASSKAGVIKDSKAGDITYSKAGVITDSKTGVISDSKAGVMAISKAGVITDSKAGDITGANDSDNANTSIDNFKDKDNVYIFGFDYFVNNTRVRIKDISAVIEDTGNKPGNAPQPLITIEVANGEVTACSWLVREGEKGSNTQVYNIHLTDVLSRFTYNYTEMEKGVNIAAMDPFYLINPEKYAEENLEPWWVIKDINNRYYMLPMKSDGE